MEPSPGIGMGNTEQHPRRRLRIRAVAAIFLFAAGPLPAPDLKLLPFPPKNFFKKGAEELLETAQAPVGPGGLCVLPTGEYVVACHPFFNPAHRVVRLDKSNQWVPFPNEEMNTPGSGDPLLLDSVVAVACDSRGVVWMLDNGRRSGAGAKLVAWDTKRNQHLKVVVVDSLALAPNSFLSNLVLDPVGPHVYIADPADGVSSAIVVVNTETGLSRRVLQGDRSVQKDPEVDLIVGGEVVTVRRPDGALASPLTGVSPLAIDRRGEWLYYGPRNGTTLYRIRTEVLLRTDITPQVLSSQVTGVSPKPICDSMTIDARGQIYFGDIGNGLIDYVSPDDNYLTLRRFVQDPRIAWPGGLTIGPDGQLHFFSSQLHRTSFFNGGKDVTAPPYSIFKTRLPTTGRFGF
jgi:sugar lactone lactonase YvrE